MKTVVRRQSMPMNLRHDVKYLKDRNLVKLIKRCKTFEQDGFECGIKIRRVIETHERMVFDNPHRFKGAPIINQHEEIYYEVVMKKVN
jgi:hypothetical protein